MVVLLGVNCSKYKHWKLVNLCNMLRLKLLNYVNAWIPFYPAAKSVHRASIKVTEVMKLKLSVVSPFTFAIRCTS